MSLATITRHGPEISDAIVSFDPNTLQRQPVKKADVLDQFTAQLREAASLDSEALRKAFVRLPPVGVLPPGLFDPAFRKQHFFPTGFEVTAVPVAYSNLNLVVTESAGLAPIESGSRERLELLVPVPDLVYEPGLLEVEQEDQRFGAAIRDLRADRQRWLVRRQMIRRRGKKLAKDYYVSQAAAISRIETIQASESIDCDFRRVDGKIRDGCGNRGQAGMKDARQAEQRGVAIKFGERLSAANHLVDSAHSAEQSQQRLLALHDHDAAAPPYERRIADELQRVAQTLLGVKQDAPASQFRAVPQRLRKHPRRR